MAGPADRAGREHRRHKTRDRSLILLLTGLILLMPPLAGGFHLEAKIAGVPATLVYVFAVWTLLIIGAAVLALRLREIDAATSAGESGARTEGDPTLDPGRDAGRAHDAPDAPDAP